MSRFRKQIYSGTCMCGHSWEDHHLGMIANLEAYEIMGGYYAQECEYYGCNETGGLDENGEDHCHQYVDKEDPDPEEEERWHGTIREDNE